MEKELVNKVIKKSIRILYSHLAHVISSAKYRRDIRRNPWLFLLWWEADKFLDATFHYIKKVRKLIAEFREYLDSEIRKDSDYNKWIIVISPNKSPIEIVRFWAFCDLINSVVPDNVAPGDIFIINETGEIIGANDLELGFDYYKVSLSNILPKLLVKNEESY